MPNDPPIDDPDSDDDSFDGNLDDDEESSDVDPSKEPTTLVEPELPLLPEEGKAAEIAVLKAELDRMPRFVRTYHERVYVMASERHILELAAADLEAEVRRVLASPSVPLPATAP